MNIQFAMPELLALLLTIPLLATLPHWNKGQNRWQRATLRYSNVKMTASAHRSWRIRLRSILSPLRWLSLILLIIALARPQIIDAQQIVKVKGIDIILALDISNSMTSLDFEPNNRLEAAKAVMQDFIAGRVYDRIGLTVFARDAFSQSPLTVDKKVLNRLLEQVKYAAKLGIEDGTAIGLGLANAANMLKNSSAKSKVIVLLTDGVNNSDQMDPLTAAKAAKILGIKVYTIGVGRPAQKTMPQSATLNERNELDEEMLQQIADITGGLYLRAEDTSGLQATYEAINKLERSEIEVQTFQRYQELAIWLLFPALLLMLLDMWLHQTIFRTLP